MGRELKKVCIIAGKRIPFMKSGTKYMGLSNQSLMVPAINALVSDLKLENKEVGEVILGAVNKHSYDFSLARECVMDSLLKKSTPATDIQKACGTSLESAMIIAAKIATGQIECGIAGGVDTNSDIAIEFKKKFTDRILTLKNAKNLTEKIMAFKGFTPSELVPKIPAIKEPRTGLSMGESCEQMAQTWNIGRSEQDELAYKSQINAAKAYDAHFFDDLIIPFMGQKKDGFVRGDTTLEKLAKLKPAFEKSEKGTITAGNATGLSDGASCVFMCSPEYAQKHNLDIMAYFAFGESAAVEYIKEEGLLMAPAYAVPRLLKQANLTLQDFDYYEIHEAFAAQVLCTLKAWEDESFCKQKLGLSAALGKIDRSKLNVNGGSLALGHPFGATGTRLVASAAKMLKQKGQGRVLISICTAGGMGVTAIIERP